MLLWVGFAKPSNSNFRRCRTYLRTWSICNGLVSVRLSHSPTSQRRAAGNLLLSSPGAGEIDRRALQKMWAALFREPRNEAEHRRVCNCCKAC